MQQTGCSPNSFLRIPGIGKEWQKSFLKDSASSCNMLQKNFVTECFWVYHLRIDVNLTCSKTVSSTESIMLKHSCFMHLVVKGSLEIKSSYSKGAVKCLNSWTTFVCQDHGGVVWFEFKISLEIEIHPEIWLQISSCHEQSWQENTVSSPSLKLWEQDKSNKGNINLGALFNFSFLFFFFFKMLHSQTRLVFLRHRTSLLLIILFLP